VPQVLSRAGRARGRPPQPPTASRPPAALPYIPVVRVRLYPVKPTCTPFNVRGRCKWKSVKTIRLSVEPKCRRRRWRPPKKLTFGPPRYQWVSFFGMTIAPSSQALANDAARASERHAASASFAPPLAEGREQARSAAACPSPRSPANPHLMRFSLPQKLTVTTAMDRTFDSATRCGMLIFAVRLPKILTIMHRRRRLSEPRS
jgi:hypothetical protein